MSIKTFPVAIFFYEHKKNQIGDIFFWFLSGVEQLDAWSAHRTETGILYYYNSVTGQSTYQKPPGFKGEVSPMFFVNPFMIYICAFLIKLMLLFLFLSHS